MEDKFSYMPVEFNYGEFNGFVASIARENADGSFDFGAKAAEPMEGACVYTEVKMRLVKCGADGSEIAVHSHPRKRSDPQG